MNKLHTRLLALLLALSVLTGLTACAAGSQVQETEPAKIEVAVKPQEPVKCTELGTPLADVRVRRALALAIDVGTILEALVYENGRKAASFTMPGEWLNEEVEGYPYDPDQAKELLAEAGWPSDYVLDVVYYYDDQLTVDLLNVIGSYWEAVGVKAEFRKLEGDLAAQLWTVPEDPKEGDSAVKWDLAYGAVAALAESEFYDRFGSGASNNSHTPQIEGLDELIEKAESAMDEAVQKDCYGQIQKLLYENVSFLPLYHQNCFIYTSDSLTIPDSDFGNDQFAYEKDFLNWVTDREDKTLYTDGGPREYFDAPVVNPGLYLYQELIFDRLICADGDLNPGSGHIAESYAVSEGGKTVEFTLREGLTWHDGENLTGEDVKFTFELYMKAPGANSLLTGVLEALEGAQAYMDGETEDCAGIVLEENRVIFRFERVAADAMKVFSQWPVLPKHCLENVRPEKLQQNKFWKSPIGSGPYKVAEVEFGDHCTLERWDGYWKTGEGNIEKVYMTASGEVDGDLAVHAAMGRIDYAFGKSTDDALVIGDMEGMNVTKVSIPYTRCFFINQYPHESYYLEPEATEPTE